MIDWDKPGWDGDTRTPEQRKEDWEWTVSTRRQAPRQMAGTGQTEDQFRAAIIEIAEWCRLANATASGALKKFY